MDGVSARGEIIDPKRVLLIEDSMTAAKALRFSLQNQGIVDITHVKTIAEACEHLRAHSCDVVLLDLTLPDATGLSGLRTLRERNPDLTVVIMTGTEDRELALAALSEGAQDFLVKGETSALLVRTLSFAVQRNTARRTIETMSAELRETNARLERANELKDLFVGMVAHDLRSPIGVVLGMSRLLQSRAKDRLTEREHNLLGRISKASEGMLALVDDLLDLASVQSGKLRLRPEPVDVGALLDNILAVSREFTAQKQITLVFERPPAPICATLDPRRYEQILDNLLTNAIKYSPPGSTVEVQLRAEGEWLETRVRDQGPGISAEDQAQLFEPFACTSAVPTAGEKSTGLGLAIVRTIVERHGGTISIDSRVGEGATFILRLPRD